MFKIQLNDEKNQTANLERYQAPSPTRYFKRNIFFCPIQFSLGQICVGKILNYISGANFIFGGNFSVAVNLKSLFLVQFLFLGGLIYNPIPAGVPENQDIPCFMSKYDKLYIIRKLLCSTFRICKKICKFAKIKFLIAKSSYIVKKFAKKNLSKK